MIKLIVDCPPFPSLQSSLHKPLPLQRDVSQATGCFDAKKQPVWSTFFFILVFFMMAGSGPVLAGQLPVVILDPGHGGQDTGAALGNDLSESQVTLQLAGRIKAMLETRGTCQPILTRDGDYSLPAHERAGMAANNRARLFLSLHAGPGWNDKDSLRVSVAYGNARVLGGLDKDDSEAPVLAARPWDGVSEAQKAGSRALAGVIHKELTAALGRDKVGTGAYPLAILTGVDAPAVIVEISIPKGGNGDLAQVLDKTARAVVRAVSLFLRT